MRGQERIPSFPPGTRFKGAAGQEGKALMLMQEEGGRAESTGALKQGNAWTRSGMWREEGAPSQSLCGWHLPLSLTVSHDRDTQVFK